MNTETKAITIETIISGNFAKSLSGNFSGKTASGASRYHVTKQMMSQLKMTELKDFKPFYAIIATNTYNELVKKEEIADEDSPYFEQTDKLGKPKVNAEGEAVTFTRAEATGVFLTYDEADIALNESDEQAKMAQIRREHNLAKLRLDNKVELNKTMKDNDLTVEGMKLLTGVSLNS